jgi:hypothetical protein
MRAPQLFVIIVFLLILAAPPLIQIAAEAVRGERPAALRILEQRLTLANMRAFEKSLQTESVTALSLGPAMQAAQFFALHDAGEKALVGPGGWLFYQPGVSYLTQRSQRGDSTVDDAVTTVVRFRGELAARGVHLIIMPAPNKESVYPDQLARGAAPPKRAIGRETRAFLAQCAAAGVEVVDLFAIYGTARQSSTAPIYLEQDTHWTPAGMEMAAAAVAARIVERGWVTPGLISYDSRPAPIRELGDLVRMIRSPLIEARVPPESIATTQVVRRDTGALFVEDRSPDVLVLGDSFLGIYQRDPPGQAGFVAHLALALGRSVAAVVSDGGASTLARQALFRRPMLLSHARVVVWEFVERDIRLGAEGWKIVPLPPTHVNAQNNRQLEKTREAK